MYALVRDHHPNSFRVNSSIHDKEHVPASWNHSSHGGHLWQQVEHIDIKYTYTNVYLLGIAYSKTGQKCLNRVCDRYTCACVHGSCHLSANKHIKTYEVSSQQNRFRFTIQGLQTPSHRGLRHPREVTRSSFTTESLARKAKTYPLFHTGPLRFESHLLIATDAMYQPAHLISHKVLQYRVPY